MIWTSIGGETHNLATFVPVLENVHRDATVQRAETWHEEKLVFETAHRLQPDLSQRLDVRVFKFVVTLWTRARVD